MAMWNSRCIAAAATRSLFADARRPDSRHFAKCLEVVLAAVLGGLFGGVCLEHAAQIEELADLQRIELADVGAAPRHDLDQSGAFEGADRFANWIP